MTNRLLIIDDEEALGRFAATVAGDSGFEVAVTNHAQDFKDAVAEWAPSHILLDLVMPEADGVELLRYLAAEHCTAAIIIMSGFDVRVLEAAKKVGVERGLSIVGTITKPMRAKELKELLERVRKPATTIPEAIALQQGMARGELFLLYQPKVAMKSGELHGVEALARWHHPQRGIVPPNDFIGLAESNGLIDELSRQVLTLAIAQQRQWSQQGLDLEIAVNLSPLNLHHEELADSIAALCRDCAVPTERITIEITESTAMSNSLQALDILTRLRLKGFKLSIDDFGTGFSSLTRLQRLPVTEIKIDQSFVCESLASADAYAIVKTVIDLARNMQLTAVAEGVESMAHYQLLADFGCDLAQGYAIGHPMPAQDMAGWKEQWRKGWSASAQN